MPSIQRASGIVLRNIPHGETSAILNLFTREFGKIGLMVKGARAKKKNGSPSPLEIFTQLDLVFYYKATRDLQIVKEIDVAHAHLGLRGSWQCYAVACAVAEFLSKCTRESDPHPELFRSTSETLDALDSVPKFPVPLLWRFQLLLFPAIGLSLTFDRCAVTSLPLQPPFQSAIRYRFADGAFLHPQADRATAHDGELSPAAYAALSSLQGASAQLSTRLAVTAATAAEITDFITRFLESHLPIRGQLRSLQALRW